MKNIVKLFCVLSLCAHAMYASGEEKVNSLTQVAKNYLQFVHDVGSAHSVQSDDPCL